MLKLIDLKTIFSELIRKHSENKNKLKFNTISFNDIQSDDVSFQAIKGHNITILKRSYVCANSCIDSYTYIGFNTLISKTQIGKYNSIANNVNIGHGEHPLTNISTSSSFIKNPYESLTERECVIEHDVWIGSGATIRRGITIGTGSVIGANAFVNKNVPPFAIVVGVPARIIRYRFSEQKIARILESKWWENDLEQAKLIIEQLEKDQ